MGYVVIILKQEYRKSPHIIGKGNALKEFCKLYYDLIVLYNTRQIPVMRHIQKSMESQTITVHYLARYKKII